jgi:hypothetical protein
VDDIFRQAAIDLGGGGSSSSTTGWKFAVKFTEGVTSLGIKIEPQKITVATIYNVEYWI